MIDQLVQERGDWIGKGRCCSLGFDVLAAEQDRVAWEVDEIERTLFATCLRFGEGKGAVNVDFQVS